MTGTDCGYHLRLPSETIIDKTDNPLIKSKEKKEPKGFEFICCRQCFQMITNLDQGIEVDGHHHHTFTNPNGIIYEIVCYRSAEGCDLVGNETLEWSWFQGYSWKIAVCKNCLIHIGWHFASAKDAFSGLINNRLLYPQ